MQTCTVRDAERTTISIIIPTLNEIDNIDLVLRSVLEQRRDGIDLDILVADGGSSDGTQERVIGWQRFAPVRLVTSTGPGGLARDVLEAAQAARGDIVVVMDADLSHPAKAISRMAAPIMCGQADMVVASRYIEGGSTPQWPIGRKIMSRLASLLAWPVADVRDPMSGFFAVSKSRLLAVDPRAAGFKIGLEVLAGGLDNLRVQEVPITFVDREHGTSKISLSQLTTYLRRLCILAGGVFSLDTAAKFTAVGLLGVVIDGLICEALLARGVDVSAANVTGFCITTALNYLLNSRWSFASRSSPQSDRGPFLRYLFVCLMALCLRGGVVATAVGQFGLPPQLALLLGIGIGAAVTYTGSIFYIFPSNLPSVSRSVRWRMAAVGIFAYALMLRLVFMAPVGLLPEEAYYWNYAQHLDIGYLDHPPMVAWLIALAASLFGKSEFAVRIFAGASWLMAAIYSYGLTRNLYGKTSAFIALALASTLPFFFFSGFLMMPDAPLAAAWSMALFYLERALVGGERRAWFGAGIAIGLGFLSKYSIALLAPATLIFLISDERSRGWFTRREPYLAAVIASVLAAPVLLWNLQHHWASFDFQGTRRLEGKYRFSLFELVGSILLLISPIGAAAVFRVMSEKGMARLDGSPLKDRRALFAVIYTGVPLAVFIAFSLFRQVKLNWTGPVWFAAVPLVAREICEPHLGERFDRIIQRAWGPAMAALLATYGALLNLMGGTVPGGAIASLADIRMRPGAWKMIGAQTGSIGADLEKETGRKPLIVGMDKYFTASELAFYDDTAGPHGVAGRSLFGRESLMYGYWFKREDERDRDMMLIALQPDELSTAGIEDKFSSLGPVEEHAMQDGSTNLGSFYYRVGHTYH